MARFLFLLVTLLSLSACSTSFYQVYSVKSTLPESAEGNYRYSDNVCEITYDFWDNGGNPGFTFTNITDEVVYIDLAKSFFICNGMANDYFLNRTASSTVSHHSSGHVSRTVQGYWQLPAGSATPGSVTSASAVTIDNAKSISVEEKRIIAIPPHSSKRINEYRITDKEYVDCDFNYNPRKGMPAVLSFSLSNTPIAFSNYISIYTGKPDNPTTIINDFYVNAIANYHHKDVIQRKYLGCPNKHGQKKTPVFIKRDPTKFYIPYTPSQVYIKD